ncbi:MAG: T9SS type A sorting domain-containing protein [Saprospiraceae bacterium]|nr:T9SS type A sorting domain-containing protein [Saprospiraceae bacterium]
MAISADCFSPLTPEDIYEDCIPVYVNVNAHVFVDTDCGGGVQFLGTSQNESYAWVENYINQCNYALINNPVQWHSNQPAACMPFRWVLRGVYMHCLTSSSYSNAGSYLTNTGSELNTFFTISPASGTSWGGHIVVEEPYISVFNHEMGHEYGLAHSHVENDFPSGHCDDTDPHLQIWDKDCDGILEDKQFGTALDEVDFICWTYITNDPLSGPGGETDKNFNSVHDCQEITPCTVSPCCDWDAINNNIMAYNAFQSAFTPCQSLRMLEIAHENPNRCKFVEAVGPACPPPSAFITQTARDGANINEYCTESLVLSACFNESAYKCDIMLKGSQALVYSTGWLNEPANDIKFTTDPVQIQLTGQNLLVLSPNTEYVATVFVENSCNDQDSYTFEFTTPVISNCSSVVDPGSTGTPLSLIVNPNPATGSVQISFDANNNEVFVISAHNLLTGVPTTLENSFSAVSGANNLSLGVSGLPTGNYLLKVQSSQKLFHGQFIKF